MRGEHERRWVGAHNGEAQRDGAAVEVDNAVRARGAAQVFAQAYRCGQAPVADGHAEAANDNSVDLRDAWCAVPVPRGEELDLYPVT
jgi:hypothetical protein